MRRFLPILITPLLLSAPAYAVSNGADADIAQTPFIAKVSGCTGTLIAPDRILTAAHCVDGRDPTGEIAVVGADPVRGPAPAANRYAVRGYARVRGYELQFPFKKGELKNATAVDDVGLVLLEKPVTGIAPVALATDAALDTPGRPVDVFGYGLTEPQRENTPPVDATLQTGRIELISRAACGRAYPGAIDARELCAQDPDGKPIVQTCSGDSGGPLLARAGDRYVQLGVLSWGSEVKGGQCGTHDRPGVWMPVWKYRSFITDADVPVAPFAKGAVAVTGERTLTCTGPAFGGTRPKISYRWATTTYRGQLRPEIAHNAKSIAGATGRTFTPPASLRGKKLVCGVKAANRSGEWEVFSRNYVI